jgi:hypothetical protein
MAEKVLKLVNGIARHVTVPTTIGELDDVTISSPVDDQVLTYEDGTSDWRNKAPAGSTTSIYDEVVVVPAGGYSINTIITLPNSGSYDGADLEVYLEGQFLEEGQDYEYVGSGSGKTQIKVINHAWQEGERARYRIEGIAAAIYDEVYVIPAGGLATGTEITLPNSGSYGGDDLEVYLGGQFLEPLFDYNYIGSAPYTKIALTFDIDEDERLRFRND